MTIQRKLQEKSCLLIQNSWRSYYTSSTYQFIRHGFILFQSLYRRRITRYSYYSTLHKIIKIQSIWRSHQRHRRYVCDQKNIIILQSAARRFIAINHITKHAISSMESPTSFRKYLLWRSRKHHRVSTNETHNDFKATHVSKERIALVSMLFHNCHLHCY